MSHPPSFFPHSPFGLYERYIKRPQDFLCALIALVLLSPILLLIALCVRLKLGSPVLFAQTRPGKDGNLFKLYKFRSMLPPQAGKSAPQFDAERLTHFGRMLRSSSLDELPELFNILKGDMSLVGPRPLLVQYLARYDAHQARRHEVRPGITGLAQINGRNAIDWNEKFNLDVRYVDKITFWEDWKIMLSTLKTVLKREGISGDNAETMSEFMGNDQ